MAKSFTITASKNGGAGVQKTVVTKDDECNMNVGFQWRLYEAYELDQNDTLSVTSISGPSNANEPLGGFSAIPPIVLIAAGLGQISLAFID